MNRIIKNAIIIALPCIGCQNGITERSNTEHEYAPSYITAIDVLLAPDNTMLDSAKAYNRMMQKNYSGPDSYLLDESHTPHITVLQCFVKTSDLEKVYAAVAKVV